MPKVILTMRPRVDILATGTELLAGMVQETNSRLLARTITRLGGEVAKIVLVADDDETIGYEIRASLAREPAAIVTIGGLGPAPDDVTLQAVGSALKKRMITHPELLKRVREGDPSKANSPAMEPVDEYRRKLSQVPEGTELILSSEGDCAAMVLKVAATTVLCLPGVPSQTESLVTGPVGRLLQSLLGSGGYYERSLSIVAPDETAILPAVLFVRHQRQNVYVKTTVMSGTVPERLTITVSSHALSSSIAKKDVDDACRLLDKQLQKLRVRWR